MTGTQSINDQIDPARVEALNQTLGLDRADLPPFGHHIYFWTALPEPMLGRDGHPAIGTSSNLIPDLGLPRRMWAGGRLKFHQALLPETTATKTSSLVRTETKSARSGSIGLVTVKHEIFQTDALCVSEEQDLVYVPEKQPERVPPKAPIDEDISEQRRFSTTQLFRYSALTFNGHRIHYDRDYARDVEGYPGLVVHGPLLAQYLILLAEAELDHVRSFEFRATAPLFDFEDATLCAKHGTDGLRLWVRGPGNRLCMTASAQ